MERLSGLDASFLYLETPQMHMHVAMMAILDPTDMPGGYSFEKVQELIASRVHMLPPFRRRLMRVPFDLHHPVWVEDPHFDIIHHVRRVAVPAPGGPVELGAIAGRINSTPLDRSRPLWEAWVIEGLENGRFAVLIKVHHAAVDGVSGTSLLVNLFTLQRDEKVAPPPPVAEAEALPDDGELFRHALRARAKQPATLLKLANETVRAFTGVARSRREPEAHPGATPLTAPRTPWNAAIGAQRNAAFARVDLAGIKTIKRAHGTTVNDVVLAITAGALRRYLAGKSRLPSDPLIAVCPISVHGQDEESAHNKVSALFTCLATDIDDPVERLLAIRRVTSGAKQEHNALGAHMLQDWAELAAPATFAVASRFYTRMKIADKHRPIHNLVISNVPGPPFPIYLAGAKLDAAYPMGPVMEGAGLNVTVMSYLGNVDFGFMVDAQLVPDVWDMATAVEPAYLELLASVTESATDEARRPSTEEVPA